MSILVQNETGAGGVSGDNFSWLTTFVLFRVSSVKIDCLRLAWLNMYLKFFLQFVILQKQNQ